MYATVNKKYLKQIQNYFKFIFRFIYSGLLNQFKIEITKKPRRLNVDLKYTQKIQNIFFCKF